MDFLKVTEISHDGVMEAWFTSIYFKLQNGTVKYDRFDFLLANAVHVALWGRIDLIKDKVRMTMGIDPRSLEKPFNISLATEDMFQVKMRGSTKKVDLDWSSAKTRIGVIAAKSAAGPLGALLGGIIESFVVSTKIQLPQPQRNLSHGIATNRIEQQMMRKIKG